MDDRLKIPALALLGLSFTDCTDRPAPANPIVGDWLAISVDGQKFPVLMSYDGYSFRYGFEMRVEADLEGDFVFYYEGEYDGIHNRSELASDMLVDDAAAPKYRIEVAREVDPFGEEPYYDTVGYGETGYADTGYATAATTYGAEFDDLVPTRPIRLPQTPDRAPAELVMNCTLDQDVLTCEREGDGEPLKWLFQRKPEESPDGG